MRRSKRPCSCDHTSPRGAVSGFYKLPSLSPSSASTPHQAESRIWGQGSSESVFRERNVNNEALCHSLYKSFLSVVSVYESEYGHSWIRGGLNLVWEDGFKRCTLHNMTINHESWTDHQNIDWMNDIWYPTFSALFLGEADWTHRWRRRRSRPRPRRRPLARPRPPWWRQVRMTRARASGIRFLFREL